MTCAPIRRRSSHHRPPGRQNGIPAKGAANDRPSRNANLSPLEVFKEQVEISQQRIDSIEGIPLLEEAPGQPG